MKKVAADNAETHETFEKRDFMKTSFFLRNKLGSLKSRGR